METISHRSYVMNTFTLAVLALLLTSGMAICRANVNDTEAQCIARYGQEFDVQDNLGFDVAGDKAASFIWKTSRDAFLIHVTFLNGVDVLEKIANADSSRDISEDQKQAILNSESAWLQWSEQATNYHTDRSDVTSGKQIWRRSDGATAICWMSGKIKVNHGWGEIDLSTKEYAAAQRDLDRQDGAR
jgi:hypothetical protein